MDATAIMGTEEDGKEYQYDSAAVGSLKNNDSTAAIKIDDS